MLLLVLGQIRALDERPVANVANVRLDCAMDFHMPSQYFDEAKLFFANVALQMFILFDSERFIVFFDTMRGLMTCEFL